jgi:hypothetical protein
VIYHLPILYSDHAPILAILQGSNQQNKKKLLDLRNGGFWRTIFKSWLSKHGKTLAVDLSIAALQP